MPVRPHKRNIKGDIDALRPYFNSSRIEGSQAVNGVAAGVDIDVTGLTFNPVVSRAGNTILLFDSGGAVLRGYAFTSAGLIAGLSAMANGDKLELCAGTITGGPWTLENGTLVGQSRSSSILDGQLTVGRATAVDSLSIIRSEDDSGAIYGLVEGVGEISIDLVNVTIDVANATGAAYAVYMANGGRIDAYDTELLAETGSVGYSVYVSSGSFYHWSGIARGTTALLPYYTI